MVQDDVFAFDIAKIVERYPQRAEINVFLLGTTRVPEHANKRNLIGWLLPAPPPATPPRRRAPR